MRQSRQANKDGVIALKVFK